MTTLVEHMLVADADNHPPMLEKIMYTYWASRMLLYIKGREHGRMILISVLNGPLVYHTIKVDGVTRPKTYEELSEKEKLQDDYDLHATNIVLQGLPPDIYALVNHNQVAKQIWDRVKLLMQGTELSYQEREYLGLAVPSFLPGDDPIVSRNKAITFLSTIIASHFPTTNNQLKSSFNPRNQASVQDGRVIVQQVQGRQSQGYVGNGLKSNATTSGVNKNGVNNAAGQARVVKCYNFPGEWHMARQRTQLKRLRNSSWFKEKLMLVEVQESGQVLDEEQLAFLADPGVAVGQDTKTTMPLNVAFHTDYLDAFDSYCDKAPGAQAILMAHISSYDSNVISEVPNSDNYQTSDVFDVYDQEQSYYKQSTFYPSSDIKITSDSNIISYEQYLKETESEGVQNNTSFDQQNAMIMSVFDAISDQVAKCTTDNLKHKELGASLTAKLESYKERVK
ncbi:hypothetical protein Tco_0415024 [Tanacetum coccineum]